MSEKLTIDLSGRGGLGPNFFGDADMVTPQPQLRYEGTDGQMADGVFNPFLRSGYMSPSITSNTTITASPSLSSIVTSVQYDTVNNDVYFASEDTIYKSDAISNTSITAALTAGGNVQDLEIYQLNNGRALYYTYNSDDQLLKTNLSNVAEFWSLGMRAVPNTTNKPTVVASQEYYTSVANPGWSIEVPSSTNMAAVVVVLETTTQAVSAMTFGGVAMTKVHTSDSASMYGAGYQFSVWYLSGITSGTKAVATTVSSSSPIKLYHTIILDEAASVPVADFDFRFGVGNTALAEVPQASNSTYIQTVGVLRDGYNITTAASISALSPSEGGGAAILGLMLSVDGATERVYRAAGDYKLYQYALNGGWSSLTYQTKTFDIATAMGVASGLFAMDMKLDGTMFWAVNMNNAYIYEFTLSTPYDISTASLTTSMQMAGMQYARGAVVTRDGSTMYAAANFSGTALPQFVIREYSLATPFSLATATDTGRFIALDVSYILGLALTANDSVLAWSTTSGSSRIQLMHFDQLDPHNIEKVTYGQSFATANAYYLQFQEDISQSGEGNRFLSSAGSGSLTTYETDVSVIANPTTEQSVIEEVSATAFAAMSSYTLTPQFLLQAGIAMLPNYGVANDSWLTSTVDTYETTNAENNFIRTADNSFAYIFAGNKVHKIDGTTTGGAEGKVTPQVLVFPTYYTIADAIDYRANIYIAINQNVQDANNINHTIPAGVYVWDRFSNEVRMRDYIALSGIQQIKRIFIAHDGSLRLITVASNGLTQVRVFNGSTFEVQYELGIGAAPGYIDSLSSDDSKTLWVAPDGNMYAIGAVRPSTPELLTKLIQMKAPGATTPTLAQNMQAGALLYGSSAQTADNGYRTDKQAIITSYNDGTVKLNKWYPFDLKDGSNTAQTVGQGDVYSQVRFFPYLAQVNYIHFVFAAQNTSGSTHVATVKVYRDQQSTPINTTNITADDLGRGFKYIKVGKTDVHSLQIELEWVTSGSTLTNQLHPAYASVDYEPTPKLK